MPQNITDVSTFTSPIVAVQDGDPANATNFKAAPQGLANRTKYLKDRVDATDLEVADRLTYDSALYTSLATFFVAVATLYNVQRNCCSMHFGDSANSTLVPGDYLVFTKDTDFSGAIAGEPTVDFLNGTGVDDDIVTVGGDDATIYELNFRLQLQPADATDNTLCMVELYLNGVVHSTYVGQRDSTDVLGYITIQASVMFKAPPSSAVKLRYATTSYGNAARITNGSVANMKAIYQLPLVSSYLPTMPSAP